jgi:putative sporulation protein YtxC
VRVLKILSLGLTGVPDEIRVRLQQDCCSLVQEGFRIAIDETSKGNYIFLGCNVAEGELSFRNYERIKNVLKNYVSNMLADTIVTREEKAMLRKIVKNNYRYFGDEERDIIYRNAVGLLENESGLFGDFNYTARRNRVLVKLQDYFNTHHELVVDGFIAFRLKDYREKLTQVVDKAVDEYMLDLEYKEFIRVLKYFVEVQEAQVEEIHVIIGDGESFRIRDSRGKILNHQQLENYMAKNGDDINYEDLLISALITIAPQHVMLHSGGRTSGVMTTIQNVFEGRVVVCPGCDLCQEEIWGGRRPDGGN